MTERLYYNDSFLHSFDARVAEIVPEQQGRTGVVLDRTAFYPTSGGQPFDTGVLRAEGAANEPELRVIEVVEREADGAIIHWLEESNAGLQPGAKIHGEIDAARRRDHMQQHSGQHVLSAAFVRLFNLHTVSFHMRDDYCSIDLDTPRLTKEQIQSAQPLANEIILANRMVELRF